MGVKIKKIIESINRGEVLKGYNKCNNIIPADWKIEIFGEIVNIVMGQSPVGESYNKDGVGVPLINGPTEFTDKYPVAIQWTSKPTKLCDVDDILICVRGSSTGRINISDRVYCIGRGVAAISSNSKSHNDYIKHLLSNIIEKILVLTTGSTFPNLSSSDLRNLEVSLPHLKEQQIIATILSTWDKAIELKEKLIEEKKKQKKGLMQKLLSGEIRLPVFEGEWKEVRLGEISDITTGKLDANAMKEDGEYKFFTCAKEAYKIDKYAFDTEALLVSGNGANVGYIHYYKGKFNAYQRTYVLDNFKENIFLIKYMLELNLSKRIEMQKNAGNTPYIVIGTLSEMKIMIPNNELQNYIANVLLCADKEINLLEQELQALKFQKKGLMQLLLTGIVRVNVEN